MGVGEQGENIRISEASMVQTKSQFTENHWREDEVSSPARIGTERK